MAASEIPHTHCAEIGRLYLNSFIDCSTNRPQDQCRMARFLVHHMDRPRPPLSIFCVRNQFAVSTTRSSPCQVWRISGSLHDSHLERSDSPDHGETRLYDRPCVDQIIYLNNFSFRLGGIHVKFHKSRLISRSTVFLRWNKAIPSIDGTCGRGISVATVCRSPDREEQSYTNCLAISPSHYATSHSPSLGPGLS